jgi:ribosome silencing factor RsfS/YbeB/iojap
MTAKRAKSTTTTRKPKARAAAPAPAKRVPAVRKVAGAPARPIARAPAKAAAKAAAKAPARAKIGLREIVLAALADMKAVNVRSLDVRGLTDITDIMVVASGTSDRHVKSIADRVVQRCKEAGFRPLGIEGERDGEWVLLDLNDVVLHVMLPRVREFYSLEKLWERGAAAA